MVSLSELIQRYGVKPSQDLESSQIPEKDLAKLGVGENIANIQYYQCQSDVDIYDSPELKALATQAATHRQLRILPFSLDAQGHLPHSAIPVCLYEDDYPGWLALDDLNTLQPVDAPYTIPLWTAQDIRDRIPIIITYMKAAMAQPNEYRWGGVVGPHYDCSGLMQAAFRSVGIWLPRDGYQQEAFIQTVSLDALEVGDLIFFGPKERANHVALYLGDRHYIHSSGKTMGRNGIGIDQISVDGHGLEDPISQAYQSLIHGAGRVVKSYQPQGIPIKPIDATVVYMS